MMRYKAWRAAKRPWITFLPYWLQHDAESLFISIILALVGTVTLLGLTNPNSITAQMPDWMFNLWGGGLVIAGCSMIAGIILRDSLLKQLSARWTVVLMLTFATWVIAAVGFERGGISFTLALILAGVKAIKSGKETLELQRLREMKMDYLGGKHALNRK